VLRVTRALAVGALLLTSVLTTGGCAPLAVGGAVAGVAVAGREERGIGGFVSDAEIQTRINKLWFDHSVDLLQRLNMTVDSGRVLLFGKARTPQQRLDAVRLAWQARGVKEVINEIQVDHNDTTVVTDAKDRWISTQIRSRITFDFSISSQNYSIDTLEGVVYLMGIAKSQAEMDAVVAHARAVAGVQRVVNYVRLATGRPAAGSVDAGASGDANGETPVAAPARAKPTPVAGDGSAPVPPSSGPMRLQ
jgi:osmotically-inducible protein OsmY